MVQAPNDPVLSACLAIALAPVEEEGLEACTSSHVVAVLSRDFDSSLVHELVTLEVLVVQIQSVVQSASLHLMNSLKFDSDRLGFDCDAVVIWMPRWSKRWL